MRLLRKSLAVTLDAFRHFNANDGWALASHIALSVLMSLFPFVIVVTALAGFFGPNELADEAARILLETWPAEVARPIAREIHSVLTTARGDVLTVGAVLALYFASAGLESLRIGLNRAYSATERRSWWLLRLESIGYVLLSAVSLLVLALLVVLGPLIFATAVRFASWLAPLGWLVTFARFAVAAVVLVVALILVHRWLPAGRRHLADIWPGIAATLVLWLAAGDLFGRYLAEFDSAYVTYYAGLASVMVALVFLYMIASIFIFGGELNAAIWRARELNRREAEASRRGRN